MKVNYIDDEKIIEDAVKDAKASLEIEGFNISKDEEEKLIKSLVSNVSGHSFTIKPKSLGVFPSAFITVICSSKLFTASITASKESMLIWLI